MLNTSFPDRLGEISGYYIEAFHKYDPDSRVPPVHVQFYPYIGINHTIRIRNNQAYVRIAEICRDMPMPAHRGLAYILVSKLMGRRAPVGARRVYADFIKSSEVRDRATEVKKTRGRKVITSHRGEVYDLDDIFESLNFWYFGGRLPKPVLSWSSKKTYRILGHHDSTHDTVVISCSLDDRHVPSYVVEYVLFHEMLHIAHPTKHINGRRYNHTPEFRKDEQRFMHYEAAEKWIENNVKILKRKARRQP